MKGGLYNYFIYINFQENMANL